LKTKRILRNCVNALQGCGVWRIQILLIKQLRSQSYLWWSPKEKEEVFYLSDFVEKNKREEKLSNNCNYFSGNNIYGNDLRETLKRLQKPGCSQEDAAYILMQRIFPANTASILMRNGFLHKDHVISEFGIFSSYLR